MRVSHLISSAGLYGAESMLLNLTRAQISLGWSVRLILLPTAEQGHLPLALRADAVGIQVQILPSLGRISVFNLKTLIRSLSSDTNVLHTHGYKADLYGALVSRVSRVPWVATCHLWTRSSPFVRVYEWLDAQALRRAAAVVGVSDPIGRELRDAGIPEKRIQVIDNGIPMPVSPRSGCSLREALKLGSAPLIGAAGRLETQKGFTVLIRAAQTVLQNHPDAHFVIAGEGSLRPLLQQEIIKSGLEGRFHLVGYQQDIGTFLRSIDVFVLPSLNEGMPMVLLEALAHGLPTVATDVGAAAKLIRPGTGTLIPPNNPVLIGAAISRYITDPQLGRRHGAAGSELVGSEYSAQAMARSYVDLYETLIVRAAPLHPSGRQCRKQRSSFLEARSLRVYMLDGWTFIPYYVAALSRALRAKSIDVTVGSVRYHLDREYLRRAGVPLDNALLDTGGSIRSPRLRRMIKAAEYAANLLALVVRFAVRTPQILHVQYLPLIEKGWPLEILFLRLCRCLGIAITLTVHNVTGQDTGMRYAKLYHKLYQIADLLILHSESAKETLLQEFSVNPQKLRIIPHGPLFADSRHSDVRSLTEKRRSFGVPLKRPIVLYAGVISAYKGLHFLLDAWQKVSTDGYDGHLLIAGTGEPALLDSLRTQVLHLGIGDSVCLRLAFIPPSELPELYQCADILVYPYSSGTTSGALLTGMQYDRPVVATDLPMFRDLLQHEHNALLVPYGDVNALAESLGRLLSDSMERERLGQGISRTRELLSDWSAIAEQTATAYRSLLEATQPTLHSVERVISGNEANT
jgi:glycosyltransferase involved in cell wall biosynthesis